MGLLAVAAASLAALPSVLFASVDERPAESAWWTWQFAPDIVIATILAAALYASGLYRLRGRGASPSAWRSGSFFAGLALIFLALQSPLDTLADRSFAVHQIQHLLLHSAGPLLIMLAAPQGPVAAGSPPALRHYVLGPVLASRAIRVVFGFLTSPAAATALFVGSAYFWQLPRYHDLAVFDVSVHYGMHVSMLLAGFVFFWCVFDPRPEPWGVRFRTRMLMVWTALASNVLLGSFTTLKEGVLYGAYDKVGRFWGVAALTDEQLGGLVMWIPGSMMYVVAAVIVIRAWGSSEARADDRRRRGAPGGSTPGRSSPGVRAAVDNRALALKLTIIAATVFAIVIGVGTLIVTRADGVQSFGRNDAGQQPAARRGAGGASDAGAASRRIRPHAFRLADGASG